VDSTIYEQKKKRIWGGEEAEKNTSKEEGREKKRLSGEAFHSVRH